MPIKQIDYKLLKGKYAFYTLVIPSKLSSVAFCRSLTNVINVCLLNYWMLKKISKQRTKQDYKVQGHFWNNTFPFWDTISTAFFSTLGLWQYWTPIPSTVLLAQEGKDGSLLSNLGKNKRRLFLSLLEAEQSHFTSSCLLNIFNQHHRLYIFALLLKWLKEYSWLILLAVKSYTQMQQ